MKEKSNSKNDIKKKVTKLSKNLNKNYYEILAIYHHVVLKHYFNKL